MLKADVKVPGTYLMNHASGRIQVRLFAVHPRKLYGSRGVERVMTHWKGTNLRTGREIEVKSAAKLIKRLDEPMQYYIGLDSNPLKTNIVAGPFKLIPELAPGQHLYSQQGDGWYHLVASHPVNPLAGSGRDPVLVSNQAAPVPKGWDIID